MTKSELAANVKEKLDCTVAEANEATQAVLDALADGIAKDGRAALAGFGVFDVKAHAARTGRNPRTGEAIKIKASKGVGFKPASALKEKL